LPCIKHGFICTTDNGTKVTTTTTTTTTTHGEKVSSQTSERKRKEIRQEKDADNKSANWEHLRFETYYRRNTHTQTKRGNGTTSVAAPIF